ncbi:MAG: glutamate-5-semialdehyde dehydrogenase [Gemmatimonadetes bacterium]|nr:glutamate-5-semialdehyde dehydrogenase [Gemmatimonadota bacterium]
MSTSSTDPTRPADLERGLNAARAAARELAALDPGRTTAILEALADAAVAAAPEILAANAADLERMDPADPRYDRLLLDEGRLQAIAADLRRVARLPTPLGEVLEARHLDNGLHLTKIRVPIGVIAVIFESRPNVTFDVVALCLRSGNACVLKGSRDARDSNAAIVRIVHTVLEDHGIDPGAVFLTSPERDVLPHVLDAVEYVDLAIPRGSRGLIDFVRDHARVPLIETGAGIVHTYVDASADVEKARAIVTNAKARRVSVCNALDTLLVHRDLTDVLPTLLEELGTDHGAEVFADPEAYAALEGVYAGPLHAAAPEHFGREFLAMKLAVRVVADLSDALEHIHRHSSKHSEAVIAEDPEVLEAFLNGVDAAAVYANTSTAFTDGGQFGMGAEIGISTQKLHARGPMALPELTSYKWVVRGDGQVRP